MSKILYTICFDPAAEKEFLALDKAVQIQARKKIEKIAQNPLSGKPLKHCLTGLYALYFFQKKYRIVYEVVEEKIVVRVICINKRDKGLVYGIAEKRR